MPSASAGVTTSNSIGRVWASASVSNACDFERPNDVQISQSGRNESAQQNSMNVAKASFNQMPFHHCIVTRSPNHMCAISCSMTVAARSCSDRFDRSGSMSSRFSRKVTHPRFSIAPNAKSGTATRSSFWPG